MSKLSLFESEYLRALNVRGHIILKKINIILSGRIKLKPIQTHLSILFTITA